MRHPNKLQAGTTAVEFALTVMVFVLFIFGIIEFARVTYIVNTLQEVTRSAAHAAAKTNFADTDKIDGLRQKAVFRSSSGSLLFADPITDSHVHIDYLALVKANSVLVLTPIATLPTNPMQNRSNCTEDPNGASCIRFVRVRICGLNSGTGCKPVPYKSIISLIPFPFNLPKATTIVTAESLGL